MNEVARVAKTSAAAIWSLVLGILGLMCFGLFSGIPAIICGHVARSNVKNSQGALSGEGMALAGLILGYVGTVITTIAVFGILAAIAIPNFIAYRDKAYCGEVEVEAMNTAAAVACYFSDPSHENLPGPDELASDPECGYLPGEIVDISISGTIDNIVITAADMSGRCPRGDQYTVSIPADVNDGWQ
jgi:hypothetical protein